MSKSRTYYISLDKLKSKEREAEIIICLMMACYDIELAYKCMKIFLPSPTPENKNLKKQADKYFIRLQIAHLREGMKIIEKIKKNKQLSMFIKSCPQPIKERFDKLKDCTKGTGKQDFEKYIIKVRNFAVFHYSAEYIHSILESRSKNPRTKKSSITLADDINLWRYKLAEDIMDEMIIKIWGATGKNIQEKINKTADYSENLTLTFVNFARIFTTHWLVENASV